MAQTIQTQYSPDHAGINRVTRGFSALSGIDGALTRGVLHGMTFVGAPVRKAGARAGAALAQWIAARKQRQADAKLWAMALTDARIMADLSRAMDRDALRDARGYY